VVPDAFSLLNQVALERILPPYPPDRSASAQRQLERLGAQAGWI